MNPTPLRKILEERFNSECKKHEMKHLYPDYKGEIKYAVVTSLSPEVFRIRYYVFFPDVKEYVLLTPEQGEAIKDFERNEKKHRERQKRYGLAEEYSEEIADEFASLPDVYDVIEKKEDVKQLHDCIQLLSKTQQRRIRMYYFEGRTLQEIADRDGASHKNVKKSLDLAIVKLRKLIPGDRRTDNE